MKPQVSEFSRPIAVERLPLEGKRVEIVATEEERNALARRFGVDTLERLSADVHLAPFANGELVRVSGRLSAAVTQTCGVTLAPVFSDIAEEFELSYAFAPEPVHGREIELDVAGEDPPEPIEDGVIDVGEVVAEQLALAIDPFPRAPDAAFEPPPEMEESKPAGPFAALEALRKGRK